MQEPPSLSQLLRESYLTEARAQQRHSEMNRSDASSSHFQIYGSLKGKNEDSVGHSDTQFPDLSAFLSQEELDKSVNLACQAIGHGHHDGRVENKTSGTLLTSSNISKLLDSSCEPASVSLVTPPSSECKELPSTHKKITSDRMVHKASTRQDNTVGNSRDSSEEFNDFNRPVMNAPYGLETQSKKEFLNKAADFIEELSSLFKANSSKRVRPRACKTHRSKTQSKSKNEETDFSLSPDNRERTVLPIEVEEERSSPLVHNQPNVQLDSEIGHEESQDCPFMEKYDTFPPAADNFASTDAPYPVGTLCEPPRFIQKLKSREIPEGSKVQLDCIVVGLPVPEVRWFCEGKELENSPDIQISTKGNLHSMVIAEAFEEDTGRYSCFASNFYGTDSTSAEIYVEGASSSDSDSEQHVADQTQRKALHPPSSPPPSAEKKDFPSAPLASATEKLSEPISSSAGNQTIPEPPPPVQTTATILLVPEVSKTSQPHLSKEETEVLPVHVSPEDTQLSGEQEVSPPVSVMSPPALTATSLHLNSLVSSLLPVSPASTQTSLPERQTSNLNYTQGLNGQNIMAAPVFTKSLQEVLASEGQLVVLECRVKGVPSPQVDWYRDGKLIEDSPDFRILRKKPRSPAESEEICTLVIAEVFPEDSGIFTCTANNKYGTMSSTAPLKVKGNARPFSSSTVTQIQEPVTTNLQPYLHIMNSSKPPSRNILMDPFNSNTLLQAPLNTSTPSMEPNTSTMLPHLSSSSSLTSAGISTKSSDCLFYHSAPRSNEASSGTENSGQVLTYQNPPASPCAVGTSAEQEVSRLSVTSPDTSSKTKQTPNYQNGNNIVLPLPDPPPNSCLKTGTPKKHKGSRSNSRVGLRVHFKLPEEEQSDGSNQSDEDAAQMSVSKEPPPVLAKPKLDPAQLQHLHNQVLLEQQQVTEPPPPAHVQPQPQTSFQIQPVVQSFNEGLPMSPRMHHEPHPVPFPPNLSSAAPLQQKPNSTPPLTITLSSAPISKNTISPAPPFSSPPSVCQQKSPVTSPPPAPQLRVAPPLSVAAVTQMNTIHASHLNLSPAALAVTSKTPQYFSPLAPKLSTVSTESTSFSQQITSPTPLLRSMHTSLINLSATSQVFNYARPKEFIASQTFSPVRIPSPDESPVPLLQELAAELSSSATSSPTIPPMSPPPVVFPTRILKSPTSPPSLMSSPPPMSVTSLNSMFNVPAQLPPKASSPTSSSSTPSPIQNPVAFLSSVLPSLTPSQPTNSMGLPRGAPLGFQKKLPKMRLPATDDVYESKEILLHHREKKLQSFQTFKEDPPHLAHQQNRSNEGKTGSRPLGPNIPATVINFDEEYKVSNFEQRLMSEIEFRLERTPVEESDDEVQHDDVPTGKCIAPIFDRKLKNFRAMEGAPVTLSCKVVGIPVPKVYWFKDGVQILKKNLHYRKIREADGICALQIQSTLSDDDGNYTIMAANPQGRISCSGHLIVQTGPPKSRMTPVHSQRVRVRVQEVEGEPVQERFFKPHFLQAPGDLLAHEGRLCRLDCKVSGLPNPELMWLVNGRPIYPDIYHKTLVQENGIHSLVIDPLTQNDAGTYTCIASNKAGQSSFSLELKVVEKEMKHPPHFVEKLQNMGIPEGTPVRLECRVVGMPRPVIFWKKDNDTIYKTKERISMTEDATGYVCLLIQPTTKDDAGWYTVSAKNEAGVVSCTCRLDIYAQWHHSVPAPVRKSQHTGSRYAALTDQGLNIKSALHTAESSPILFSSSPPEATLESEEL